MHQLFHEQICRKDSAIASSSTIITDAMAMLSVVLIGLLFTTMHGGSGESLSHNRKKLSV